MGTLTAFVCSHRFDLCCRSRRNWRLSYELLHGCGATRNSLYSILDWTRKGVLVGEEACAGKARKAAQHGLSYSQHGWPWFGAGQCICSSSFHNSFLSLLLTKHAQVYVWCAKVTLYSAQHNEILKERGITKELGCFEPLKE